jgi:hypothetical protein
MGKMILNGKEYAGSSGTSNLADLNDVDVTSLADGQILKWDSVVEKFVNSIYKNSNSIFIPEDGRTGQRLFSMNIGGIGATANTGWKFQLAKVRYANLVGIIISRFNIGMVNLATDGNGDLTSDRVALSSLFKGTQGANLSFTCSNNVCKIYDGITNNSWGFMIGATSCDFTVTIGE